MFFSIIPHLYDSGSGKAGGRGQGWPLRAGLIAVKRPRNGFDKVDPKTVSLTLVEAREIDPPANEDQPLWRLLTTIAVKDADGACEIVRLYLKSDGMCVEETQMHEAARLFKLAAIGLAAACRTIQLVDARDGGPRPATDVIEPASLPAVEAIGPGPEGKTRRQKNPHPLHSLAWLAWIASRLGGWNCYYKPPGPKTMRARWARLETMVVGFTVGLQIRIQSIVRLP